MSTDPTTTSQVQAYRFTLRRMESALVRKDAVMLHEPMRHHLRAMVIGVILALLGLAAFFVIGKLSATGKAHASGMAVATTHSSLPSVVTLPEWTLTTVPFDGVDDQQGQGQ